MRLKVVFAVGFGLGYYLGARAGRERYEQMRGWLGEVRQSKPYEKAQAAVELGVERVRHQAESLVGSSNGPGSAGTATTQPV